MKTLKLATLNLWGWEFDWNERLEATSAWVQAEGIDVLCVQEVITHTDAPTSVQLAALSGLTVATPLELDGVASTTAVLCNAAKIPVLDSALVPLKMRPAGDDAPFMAVATLDTTDGPLPVGSVHLAWGSLGEATRLTQLQHVAGWFDDNCGSGESEAAAIVAGDFNAWPDSESVRYLRGRTVHSPATHWTDAWDHQSASNTAQATSSGFNRYAVETALTYRTGRDGVLRADLLPERRIDFVFSRGWRHGRAFTLTQTKIVDTLLMSDHYPVVTELLLS